MNGTCGHDHRRENHIEIAPALPPSSPWWSGSLRRLVGASFPRVARGRFDLRIRGLEDCANRPATLVISNHTTDWDVVLLTAAIYERYGLRPPLGHIAYAAGEHMFESGYLGGYVLRRPDWLRRAVYPLNLGPVLEGLRAYPIPRARRRKLGLHLRTILRLRGNVPLAQVFKYPPHRFLPDAGAHTPLKRVLRWRYHEYLERYHGFSIFEPELARTLRTEHMQRISDSLACLAGVLTQGGSLFISPEDGLSTRGWSGQVRAGVSRVIALARCEVTILPVNIQYDRTGPDKPLAVVSFGSELRRVERWPRCELETRLTQAILSLQPTEAQAGPERVLERRSG